MKLSELHEQNRLMGRKVRKSNWPPDRYFVFKGILDDGVFVGFANNNRVRVRRDISTDWEFYSQSRLNDFIVDSFRKWEKSHNRDNYGRYDAFKAGFDLAKKKLDK